MKDIAIFPRNPRPAACNASHHQSLKPGKRSGNAGFTMGEMVIVIAIVAILAALITPLAVDQILQGRYDACREELDIIKKAIAGDPALVEGGVRSSFGFVGDVGVIPSTTDGLEDLVSNTSATGTIVYPAWDRDSTSGIWYGWRGPYINEFRDPWRRNYRYLVRASTPTDRTIIAIWSAGPDGNDNSSDDIIGPGDGDYGDDSAIIRISEDELFSTISGNVMDPCGALAPCDGANPTYIVFYYPSGTAGIQNATRTLDTGVPIFDTGTPAGSTITIPIGIRSISATINYVDSIGSHTGSVNRFIYINNGPIISVNLRAAGPCNN